MNKVNIFGLVSWSHTSFQHPGYRFVVWSFWLPGLPTYITIAIGFGGYWGLSVPEPIFNRWQRWLCSICCTFQEFTQSEDCVMPSWSAKYTYQSQDRTAEDTILKPRITFTCNYVHMQTEHQRWRARSRGRAFASFESFGVSHFHPFFINGKEHTHLAEPLHHTRRITG